ncbi:MAG: beta-propeller domain-containing protein [Acidobacteria bacterium]|nr:beta-propeller domain-containing protein [Acidobacteriota bacterium]
MRRTVVLGSMVLFLGIAAYSLSYPGIWGFMRAGRPRIDEPTAAKPGKTMKAFTSDADLKEYMRKFQETHRRAGPTVANAASNASSDTAVAAAPAMEAKSEVLATKAGGKDDESITNTQHAGVDEGGIVKVHGDYLVILRRGRLFTVKVGGNSLEPTSSVNAYPPGINPSNDWYDEMLVSKDRVVVIGYSYGRGGTEINLFDIDAEGRLSYRSTYHLRSNDYYSSRNYASRLIGDKLIFYTPEYVAYGDPGQSFPALRKWHRGAKDNEFRPVVSATTIYRPQKPIEHSSVSALHTVTVCDLSSRDMSCKGTAVLGAPGRVFYVSPKSVYVWATDWEYGSDKPRAESMLYKLPLDGSAPSALGVDGAPVDQFSFLETDNEQLNVLIGTLSAGDSMWSAERPAGDLALFQVNADAFSDGSESAFRDSYHDLPNATGSTFQNRFVGDYVLYGSGDGWGPQAKRGGANLIAANWRTHEVTDLHLDHSVDRIEKMGDAAVVVGTNGSDLCFSPVKLGSRPLVRPSYIRKQASQGELRSHGFFYKPDGDDTGVLGLPIAREGRSGYRHLIEDSAAIIFLRNNGLQFNRLGELEAKNPSSNDGCRASCVDWYGNARPIFLRGRVFALLGYELVEGRLSDSRIREVRRINYSPRSANWSTSEEE